MSHAASLKVPDRAPRRIGVVATASRAKTRKVVISSLVRHPRYGKYVRHRSVLHVHDEGNESKLGDRVEIAECRPISRTKRWTLVRIVERAPEATEIVYGEKAAGA